MRYIIILVMVSTICLGVAPYARAFDTEDLEIHGFISQGYLKTDHNNYMANTEEGTFQFNEMGLNFSMGVTDQLRVSTQIFSRDLGDMGNNEIGLGYGYGDYRWQNWLGIRAGKIKIDYGLCNETREMDMLRTGINLPQSVYPEVWRDSFSNLNGASLYGYLPGGVMGSFSYNALLGAMEFDKEGGFANHLAPRLESELDLSEMDADYAWFANIGWQTPLSGLKAKGSYYRIEGLMAEGDVSMTTREGDVFQSFATFDVTKKDGYILSLEYMWENLVLTGEFSEDSYDFDVSKEDGIEAQPPEQEGEKKPEGEGSPGTTSQGWYLSASYRFTDWLETALTYSVYYPDKDNKDGDKNPEGSEYKSWLKTTTLSSRFDINEYWTLKLEGSYNDGFGGVDLAENEDGTDPHWWLFGAKMTFSF